MNRSPTATPMRRRSAARPLRVALASLATVALTGCATVVPDGLRSQVASHAAGRTAGVAAELPAADPAARTAAQQQIQAWLTEPLTADRAVRIALLQNPGLQERLASLGMADADRVQALTLPNPHLSLARLVSPHGREIERSLAFSLVDWITLPWRSRWLGLHMEVATLETAQDAVRLAAQARRAWVRAVAAEQVVVAHERMHEAAEAGAELARRMAQVGNWSRLKHAREQAVLADAAAQLARARLTAALERERLHQVLGLWGPATAYRLVDRLPDLPATPQTADALEATALRERLDVRAARLQLDADAERAGWARAGAVFGDIGLAYQRHTKTERDGSQPEVTRGWELGLPLPLLDWGGAARTRAQAQVERQAALLQGTALQARTEVRSAWLTYRTAYDLARQQREEVVPLHQLIADETTLRYNGMLASVWDLLAAARASTRAVAQATEAQRDFWLAEVDLQLALTGTSGAALARLTPAAGDATDTGKGH